MKRDEDWLTLLPEVLSNAGIPAADGFEVHPLKGGVSSDIVRVHLSGGRDLCAKRALPKLLVADDWRVPVERNRYEVAWLRRAAKIVPGAVPAVVGEDCVRGIALMEYLPPEKYYVWKQALLSGTADAGVAAAVAGVIGRIHAATLNDPEVAAEFPTDAMFDALRLDPYLRATAERHPDLAPQILARLEETRATKLALVHGDLSPKNILVSREDRHVVILDAECAWFGDPAFDAAFCLNHLVLKAIHMPERAGPLLADAARFLDAWLECFAPALRPALAERSARLLPCLMLARVHGKSPVEYLTPAQRQTVRAIAEPMIVTPPAALDSVIARIEAVTGSGGD